MGWYVRERLGLGGRLREDAELGSLPGEECVVGGELAGTSKSEGQGGAGEEQNQLVSTVGNEDASRCVNQEQCAEHVNGEEGCEDPGQEPDNQRDTSHEFKGCNHWGYRGSAGDTHLREGGLRSGDGEFVELLPTVRGEEKTCNNAEDGQGCGAQAGLVHSFNLCPDKLKSQPIKKFRDFSHVALLVAMAAEGAL